MQVRRQLEVAGIVQGVGFRPYVYRLATARGLAGTICNTAAGVTIEVQGSTEAVADFSEHLRSDAPPLARITSLTLREVPCNGDRGFRIVHSQGGEAVRTLISPDVAICDDCLGEVFDAGDRRYRYPFINCTNCGPRFTIVRNIPYDRPSTSMAVFPMCPACQAEYDDPLNRRFHAQPNACWDCGPRVDLRDRAGEKMEGYDPIAEVVRALSAGAIVAVKGLGGFHLAADATNPAAVETLRERKRRVEKPFAVMVPDVNAGQRICELDEASRKVLQSIQRPIVLLPKKGGSPVVDQVAPFNRFLGIFLPYTPLHYLIMREGGFQALVMTSGNLSEEPIAIENGEALTRLQNLADYFLMHNRDILLRCDDSVVCVSECTTRQLRRSRGFVPVPVFLRDEQPPILAVGGELKNTICLTKGRHAFLSQHIGDLENGEGYKFFVEAISHLERILEIRPEIVAYDLHPDYFSTRWALQQNGVQLVGVQHHHAHIASCMAENHLDEPVIGVALDGTGYGTDGCVWGGEALVADYAGFERAAHFEYVPMPGGTAAIREPWRMAVSYLFHQFGHSFLSLPIPFVQKLDANKTEVLLRMSQQQLNSPLTSSCGRLFDAVASLIGIRQQINYEAQAAIELEFSAQGKDDDRNGGDAYSFELKRTSQPWLIGTRSMFEALIEDLGGGISVEAMARRFHNGVVDIFLRIAIALRESRGLNCVCLSGGAFNNVYLSSRLESKLVRQSFRVFTHHEVPAGDGGLSLGQALVASHTCSAGAYSHKSE
jgi:hydrogenase maturation protein HypF